MTFTFKIDPSALAQESILYFEDANSSNSQFHAIRKSTTIDDCKQRVQVAMSKLGGAPLQFIPVIFENPSRYGYLIEYVFSGGAHGQLPVAGLPLKNESPSNKVASRKQALMVAAHMMNASYNAIQHTPLSNPLLLHLLVDGKQTVAQMIAERQSLPTNLLLGSGKNGE